MSFADALRAAMADESQNSLARRSGVKQAQISRFLAGHDQPALRTLDALERALPQLRALRASQSTAVA